MDGIVFSSFTKEALTYGGVSGVLRRAAEAGVDPARLAGIQATAGRIASRAGAKAGEGTMLTKAKPQTKLQRILRMEPETTLQHVPKYQHGSPERTALVEQMTQHGAIGRSAEKLRGVAREARAKPSADVIPIQEKALRAVQQAA